MNAGSRRVCRGFRVATLNTLADTKSASDRNTTLLHFLVRTIRSKRPELEDLPASLSAMEPAARIQLDALARDAAALVADAQRLAGIVDEVAPAAIVGQDDDDDDA